MRHAPTRTRWRAARGTAAALIVLAAVILPAASASAHGHKHLGDLEMTIGFGTEPAYSGQPNSVQLILVHDGKPVTDLGDTLKVEISFGDETSAPMALEPNFEVGEWGEPGDYRADFAPSQPGKYTFHFKGTIDGEKIDESMTSGPKTFSEVADLADSEFPKVDAPTTTELADRIEAESARTQEATDAAASAADDASKATTFGIVGIIIGSVGVIVAVVAVVGSRKRKVA
jgi:hypothetical protein